MGELHIDADRDGVAESILVDTTGDGVADISFNDTGDGWADQYRFDFDQDGFYEAWAYDPEQDGKFLTIYYDHNRDGLADVLFCDDNRDGVLDSLYVPYESGTWVRAYSTLTPGPGSGDLGHGTSSTWNPGLQQVYDLMNNHYQKMGYITLGIPFEERTIID